MSRAASKQGYKNVPCHGKRSKWYRNGMCTHAPPYIALLVAGAPFLPNAQAYTSNHPPPQTLLPFTFISLANCSVALQTRWMDNSTKTFKRLNRLNCQASTCGCLLLPVTLFVHCHSEWWQERKQSYSWYIPQCWNSLQIENQLCRAREGEQPSSLLS